MEWALGSIAKVVSKCTHSKTYEEAYQSLFISPMDKTYVDFAAFAQIDAEGGIFVLRAKDNMKYEIVSTNFNLIKQNLNIKHMLGCSGNAVKIHLWTAVISYLLQARVKAVYESPYSISEIVTLVKVCALRKTGLKALVTEPQPLIQNQDVNELTLF